MAEDKTSVECPFCHNIVRSPKGRDPLYAHTAHCQKWPDTEEEVFEALKSSGLSVDTLLQNAMDQARTMLADTVIEVLDRMESGHGSPREMKSGVVYCTYCTEQLGIIPGVVDGPTDAIIIALPMDALMGLTENMIQHVVKEHTPGLNPGLVNRRRAGEN